MHDELSAGLHHHQRGQLAEAVRCYHSVLSRKPDHSDALHLLGLVAYQQGQLEQAIELIGRAIHGKPGAAAFHCNLAEVYRALGKLDQAVESCREALRLQPNYMEATNNLGMALLARNDPRGAAEQFRAALQLRPDNITVHNNLACALRAAGDQKGAAEQCRAALRLCPDFAEAHSNLGQILLERYDRQGALSHCREAVRLRPDLAEAQNNLGNVLRELGQLPEARACYQEALRLAPHAALTYSNLGQVLQQEGALAEAIASYQMGLALDANSARIHAHLATALREREEYLAAREHFHRAIQLAPDDAEVHNGFGELLHDRGRYPEAVAEYREVLRLRPDHAAGHCSLGHILEELGSFDEAQKSYREALRCDPEHTGAYASLATMLRGKLPAEDLDTVRRLLAGRQPPGRRIPLLFGLAHVLDAQGDFAGAAETLREGNALCLELWRKQGLHYDPSAHGRFVDNLIATFSPEFYERAKEWGSESRRPIFIVGLPRSGTTLTEQILASHSHVFGAGELNDAREIFEQLPRFMETADSPFACLARIDQATVQRLAGRHLDRLAGLDANADRVADKMPENYFYLGLLALLFPGARFIHCRRDLRDVAVSCWMTYFRNIRWSSDFDHIAGRFFHYWRLMEHWRRTLPVPILEIDYEETVADLEATARRLVTWCDLDWEPACLAFHEKSRPVRTASLTQVRQPIYTRSVARWRNYEPDLGPLFARLAFQA